MTGESHLKRRLKKALNCAIVSLNQAEPVPKVPEEAKKAGMIHESKIHRKRAAVCGNTRL